MRALRHLWLVVALAGIPSGLGAGSTNDPPLPSLVEIFPKVVERAKKEPENDRQFQLNYIFVHSKLMEFRNGDGDLKKREPKVFTNYPALKRQREQAAKPPPPRKNEPVSETHSNVRGKQFDEKDFGVSSNLVTRFDFKLVGRVQLNQRPTLIIDFEPKKGKLPERNLKDKFINKAAGRVWLDEEDYAISKVDLRLTERVNVLGGLVGAIWKFGYQFERDRLPDGIWFTRDETWHLEGREVIFNRVVDFHGERTAVEKEKPPAAETATAGR